MSRAYAAAVKTSAPNPKAVAEKAKVVITMLPDSPQVREVALGPNGLIEGMAEGSLHIDMSTIAPSAAIEVSTALAGIGAHALDAPVSGGEAGAINAALSIMVGGAEADVERAMPYFEKMGKTIVHVGASGAGQTVKACNQVMVAINYAAMAMLYRFVVVPSDADEQAERGCSGGTDEG